MFFSFSKALAPRSVAHAARAGAVAARRTSDDGHDKAAG
jgi:hypothetical protein